MKNDTNIAVIPPGEHIREELEDRGWSPQRLATLARLPLPVIQQLIAGEAAISTEIAKGLAAAFGTSDEVWLRLEARYRSAKSGAPAKSST